MVTSALFMSFLSQGSIWRPLSKESSQEDSAISGEAGIVTDSERRQQDVFEVKGGVEEQDGMKDLEALSRELNEGLRGIRRTLDESRTQWANRRQRTSTYTEEECPRMVKLGRMAITDERNALGDLEEAYRFEALLGQVQEFRSNLELDLIPEDGGASLPDWMRISEQDEFGVRETHLVDPRRRRRRRCTEIGSLVEESGEECEGNGTRDQ
jgi:hypothetical protein